jgi:hypothetical protein
MYASPKNAQSFQAQTQVTKANVVATAASLLSISASNVGNTPLYLQIFDKASAPNGSDAWKYCFALPAGSATLPGVAEAGVDFFGALGIKFFNGISWAISTTYSSFTDAATNTNLIVNGHYWTGTP